jgi:hypothetical protein
MMAVRGAALVVLTLLLMGADAGGTTDAVGLLREFGFPIFVSLWFMWRVEKRMDRFTDAIQQLLTAVTVMAKTVDDLTPGGRASSHHDRPPTVR